VIKIGWKTVHHLLYSLLEPQEVLGRAMQDVTLSYELPPRSSGLHQSLYQVAKVIKSREALGAERDVFYVSTGGFDTHNEVIMALQRLYGIIDDALGLFVNETKLMGVWENVTIVSMSEFGRTLTSNGRGTDHGWGGNHFVLGGGIRGGQIHGKYLPSFKSGSSHVLGTNALRALPALPWEAMWQPIAKWFGVDENSMSKVLPNLENFPAEQLIAQDSLYKKSSVAFVQLLEGVGANLDSLNAEGRADTTFHGENATKSDLSRGVIEEVPSAFLWIAFSFISVVLLVIILYVQRYKVVEFIAGGRATVRRESDGKFHPRVLKKENNAIAVGPAATMRDPTEEGHFVEINTEGSTPSRPQGIPALVKKMSSASGLRATTYEKHEDDATETKRSPRGSPRGRAQIESSSQESSKPCLKKRASSKGYILHSMEAAIANNSDGSYSENEHDHSPVA